MIPRSLVSAAAGAAVIAAVLAIALAPVSSADTAQGDCPPGSALAVYCSSPPQITATMQWTFFFAPKSTKVMSLVVNGATLDNLLVSCNGRGCPYTNKQALVRATKPCGKRGKRTCPTHGVFNLSPAFAKHKLAIGTKLSVAITRTGWIGKYYLFTVRAAQAPSVQISCLAPGQTHPGDSC